MDLKNSRVIFLLFLASCSNEDQKAISPSNDYAMTDAEVVASIESAKAGDARATDRLINYYWIYRTDKEKEALYWLKVSAKRGNTESIKSYIEHCKAHSKKSSIECKLEIDKVKL